ncbi:hypothetical protein DL93DRAFT_1180103 [Clavulina sp. PMI_390]|nr:hypothetical protein DL93DRAFT_1180103 [Clavulina sp. PMI_390]
MLLSDTKSMGSELSMIIRFSEKNWKSTLHGRKPSIGTSQVMCESREVFPLLTSIVSACPSISLSCFGLTSKWLPHNHLPENGSGLLVLWPAVYRKRFHQFTQRTRPQTRHPDTGQMFSDRDERGASPQKAGKLPALHVVDTRPSLRKTLLRGSRFNDV